MLSIALLLTGCGLFGGNDSPFDLGKLSNGLWIESPYNDAEDGEGVLILSDEEMGCGTFGEMNGWWLDDLTLKGSGLLYLFEYNSGADNPHGDDWTGLWYSGYALSPSRGDRMMRSFVFQDGFLYVTGSYYSEGDDAWIQVEGDDGGLSGEYSHEFSHGSFASEDCGTWNEYGGETGETGWDDTAW